MVEEDIIKGNPISLQWDKEEQNWIIIKDSNGEIIMKITKQLWDFDIVFRDNVLATCRRLYG